MQDKTTDKMIDITDQHQPNEVNPSLHDLAELMAFDFSADDSAIDLPPQQVQAEMRDEVIDGKFCHHNSEIDEDIFDAEEFNPEKNRTKISFQQNGAAKAAVVGGGSLAIILGGTAFFQGQLPKDQVAQVVKKKDPVDTKIESAQAALTKAQQSESEIKAQLALARQKDALAQAHQQKASPQKTPSPKTGKAIADSNEKHSYPVTQREQHTRQSQPVVVKASSTPILQPISIPTSSPDLVAAKTAVTKSNKTSRSQRWLTVATSGTDRTRSAAVVKSVRTPKVSNFSTQPAGKIPVTPSVSEPLGEIVASNKATQKFPPKADRTASAAPLRNNRHLGSVVPAPGIFPSRGNEAGDPNREIQQLAAVGRYGIVTTPLEITAPPKADSRTTDGRNAGLPSVVTVPSAPPLSQYFQRYVGQNVDLTPEFSNTNNAATGNSTRPAFANSQKFMQDAANIKSDTKESLVAKNGVVENGLPTVPAIRTLLVGTSAKGSAITPVLWGGGANGTARFLLKLDEPMLDGNNHIAFPAGTQFVVTAKSANSNIGLAELEVVSVIIQGMEFAPPAGAIAIRDNQGGLLVGEDYFKREEQVANRDILGVFAGALSGVGRILNQPTTNVSSNVSGTGVNTTSVVTNRDPNVLGAVLEGGFQNLSSVWSQRNQQAIQEITSKPNVYQIPSGRSVRVFVNQSMTF